MDTDMGVSVLDVGVQFGRLSGIMEHNTWNSTWADGRQNLALVHGV
jgi:2-polyprenyl-3-methyl-5-hydroxy-6-metoxy-1,4-benzoquinol methylase